MIDMPTLAAGPAGCSPDEMALLANFRAMNDAGRDRLISFSRHLQRRFVRQRPALALVRTINEQDESK